ncbi:MAG TPA: hypothetical protein VFZ32_12565 [Micromonosporaceae bacterium]|jgi:hypothetical protein
MTVSVSRIRLGAVAFAVAGVLFLLYPVTRPWRDESTLDGATRAMGSGWWVASHLFAMIGFILLPLGLLAVWGLLVRTRVEPLAVTAVVVTWIGAGLTLPYYGAEDFALNAAADRVAAGRSLDLLDLAEAVRFGAVAATTFALGLLSLAAGTVLAAVAIWRSRSLSRYSGVPLALGFVLFIPQFFTPPAVRIGHGLLVALGLVWLAAELWRATSDR